MPLRLVAVLTVALLGAAACGSSSDDQDPVRGDEDTAATAEIRATDFEFDPELIEVDPGEDVEVTLVNAGNVAHTFTAEDAGVDVEAASGEEATASFTAPEEDTTIEFVCRFHPSEMKGELVVGTGGSGAGGSSGEDDSGSDELDY